ncbi:hypothetical protein [Streptomyces shaanxiensis]|uniref:Uncharacterized protein n=1 Tax=Streptomyces shaanxiensis TaxID=653357 RepID=A0ABP7W5S1_9ACTN
MPTHSRMLTHAPWAPCGSSRRRRLVSALRGALLMALMLCAFAHGVSEDAHEPASAPVVSSVTAAGGEPHGPHGPHPHRAEDCAADLIVRTGAQSVEDLPLGAPAVVVLVVVSVTVALPFARHASRRRRSARTGRAALVRTCRWRI